jgi:hypothetical protein
VKKLLVRLNVVAATSPFGLKLRLVQMLPCPDITAYDKCQFQVQKHLLPWRKTFKLHQDYSEVIPVKMMH